MSDEIYKENVALSRLKLVAGSLLWSVPLGAQDSTGAVTGQVVDGTTQQPLANVEVAIAGTPHRMLSRNDGSFLISGLAPGIYRVRATRIGYGSQVQSVTVTAGGTVTLQLSLLPAAAILEPVVVTGYGTQRREAITGSVSTVSASAAYVGVVANVDQMIQGRVAGVDIIQNNGEPGAGAQILIRGGSSISNSNDPLYVVDGVPINNVPTEPPSFAFTALITVSSAGLSTVLRHTAMALSAGCRPLSSVSNTKSGSMTLLPVKSSPTSMLPSFNALFVIGPPVSSFFTVLNFRLYSVFSVLPRHSGRVSHSGGPPNVSCGATAVRSDNFERWYFVAVSFVT